MPKGMFLQIFHYFQALCFLRALLDLPAKRAGPVCILSEIMSGQRFHDQIPVFRDLLRYEVCLGLKRGREHLKPAVNAPAHGFPSGVLHVTPGVCAGPFRGAPKNYQ